MEDTRPPLFTESEVNSIIKNDKLDANLISDGYHTFGELYEHRIINFMMLCAFVNLYTDRDVWKSKLHHDGTNYPGWFIMGIGTTKGQQISYHLPEKYWEASSMATSYEKAPEWDGHTSTDVLERLKKLL